MTTMINIPPVHQKVSCLPAAILSPPRRSNILPISLFVEKVSIGIARTPEFAPDVLAVRRLISTSAETPLPKTLSGQSVRSVTIELQPMPTED